ncbi:UNVERIFIED_CONTAM: hypothetical protein FKN15_064483 [Acipenser sinensis]
MDLEELIEMINRNTAAQKEQTKKWRQELGLPDPEPTELELLLQKWEQAEEAWLSAAPAREAPESLAPEELLQGEQEEETVPEPEEVSTTPPPQLQPTTPEEDPALVNGLAVLRVSQRFTCIAILTAAMLAPPDMTVVLGTTALETTGLLPVVLETAEVVLLAVAMLTSVWGTPAVVVQGLSTVLMVAPSSVALKTAAASPPSACRTAAPSFLARRRAVPPFLAFEQAASPYLAFGQATLPSLAFRQ